MPHGRPRGPSLPHHWRGGAVNSTTPEERAELLRLLGELALAGASHRSALVAARLVADVERLIAERNDLLARIHRDGGHHSVSVGDAQSIADAHQKIVGWLASEDEAQDFARLESRANAYYTAMQEAEAAAVAAESALAAEREWAEKRAVGLREAGLGMAARLNAVIAAERERSGRLEAALGVVADSIRLAYDTDRSNAALGGVLAMALHERSAALSDAPPAAPAVSEREAEFTAFVTRVFRALGLDENATDANLFRAIDQIKRQAVTAAIALSDLARAVRRVDTYEDFSEPWNESDLTDPCDLGEWNATRSDLHWLLGETERLLAAPEPAVRVAATPSAPDREAERVAARLAGQPLWTPDCGKEQCRLQCSHEHRCNLRAGHTGLGWTGCCLTTRPCRAVLHGRGESARETEPEAATRAGEMALRRARADEIALDALVAHDAIQAERQAREAVVRREARQEALEEAREACATVASDCASPGAASGAMACEEEIRALRSVE